MISSDRVIRGYILVQNFGFIYPLYFDTYVNMFIVTAKSLHKIQFQGETICGKVDTGVIITDRMKHEIYQF